MKKCSKCGMQIDSGYIICSQCNDQKDIFLNQYIDRLTELMTADKLSSCALCAFQECGVQPDSTNCQKGVRRYLTTLAKEFERPIKGLFVSQVRKSDEQEHDYLVKAFYASNSQIAAHLDAQEFCEEYEKGKLGWHYYVRDGDDIKV